MIKTFSFAILILAISAAAVPTTSPAGAISERVNVNDGLNIFVPRSLTCACVAPGVLSLPGIFNALEAGTKDKFNVLRTWDGHHPKPIDLPPVLDSVDEALKQALYNTSILLNKEERILEEFLYDGLRSLHLSELSLTVSEYIVSLTYTLKTFLEDIPRLSPLYEALGSWGYVIDLIYVSTEITLDETQNVVTLVEDTLDAASPGAGSEFSKALRPALEEKLGGYRGSSQIMNKFIDKILKPRLT